ncbi:MAG: hypothetical protein QNJ72_04800 [Pleurocapsa sp. MO_226.B13]|nr:hypothetical protein [Pleurocapsa sp. MO_226.B13]
MSDRYVIFFRFILIWAIATRQGFARYRLAVNSEINTIQAIAIQAFPKNGDRLAERKIIAELDEVGKDRLKYLLPKAV